MNEKFNLKEKEFNSYLKDIIDNDSNYSKLSHRCRLLFENAYFFLDLENKEFKYFLIKENLTDDFALFIYFSNCIISLHFISDDIESQVYFNPIKIQYKYEINTKNYLLISVLFDSKSILNFEFKESNLDYGLDFLKHIYNNSLK